MVAASLRRQTRTVLSLTTRFCLPHEGMTQLEYLSRGSAFLLDGAASPASPTTISASPPQRHDLKILTCQHVACPWLFPNYFADKWDWLQHVSEEFVQHSLQLLELPPDGVDMHATTFRPRVLVDLPLANQVWLHPDRDVALLAVDEQDDERWSELVAKWSLHALALDRTGSTPGDLLLFSGHTQLEEKSQSKDGGSESDASSVASITDKKEEQEDDDKGRDAVGQYPKQVFGRFVGQSARGQAFAWSEEILEEGMCGGAVLNEAGDCVGLVEGIVPPFNPSAANADTVVSSEASHAERDAVTAAAATTRMQKALENHVAFVPSIEIHEFLEDTADHSLLTGMGLDL